MNYEKHIDALRGISVIAVILYHLNFAFIKGGFLGVDVFFTISGYLIASIIFEQKKNNIFSFENFYLKRARRILPILFFSILISIILSVITLLPSELEEFNKSIIANLIFLPNVFFWKSIGYFDQFTQSIPLLHTWSLGIEIQFYIIYPLLIFFFEKKIKIITFLFFFMSLIMCIKLSNIYPSATFYLFPTRAWEILLGSIIYLKKDFFLKINSNIIKNIFALLGLILLILSFILINKNYNLPNILSLIPAISTCMIILYASEDSFIGKILSNKILIFFGLISYSLYLFHYIIISYFYHLFIDEKLIIIVLSLMISTLSWKLIEIPFRNSLIISNKSLMKFIIFVILIISAYLAFSYLSKNFIYLYKDENKKLVSLNKTEQKNYVVKRFNELKLVKFNDSKNQKILIIGDSYAQDLVNIIYENNVNRKQISTFHISFKCGALFIDKEKLLNNTPVDDYYFCKNQSTYLLNNQKINFLIKEADQVWITSNWKDWQIKFLNESIKNIKKVSNKPIIIFGSKHFGDIKIKKLIKIESTQRLNYLNEIDPTISEINEKMKKTIQGALFVNMQTVACGYLKNKCKIFLDKDTLITFDGAHLTKSGAKFIGEKLDELIK